MSNLVPRTTNSSQLTPLQRSQAMRSQRQAELTVFRHGLDAAVRTQCDIQDTLAVESAARAALNAEIGLLQWGCHQANNSLAALELVARKVQLLASLNDQRIARTFGV
jgi:hypothetical protein